MAPQTFFEYLSTLLPGRVRLLLAVLAIPVLCSFAFPLWRIDLRAPQYPAGLTLDIYSYKLEPGHDGGDLNEINILNHYIGMRPITRDELRDLDWIPFALGGLALLTWRVALLGTIRSLIDLAVITAYVTLVAFGRFIYMLYTFGHELDPEAPIDVEPFTPALIGGKQIANFTTYSYPLAGSVLIGVFATGLWVSLLWLLWAGRKSARGA